MARILITVLILFLPLRLVQAAGLPPLYLTFVSHNEEPDVGVNIHDYENEQDFYLQNREFVRQLALVIKNKGAMWNFQSDWNFLKAAAKYDTGTVTSDTNGKNIVKWLVEDLGFEADPHAHETRYNYADVAYLHTLLGVTPSKNVGGFLYNPPDNGLQNWEQYEQGTYGIVYPFYFWKPDNLWGAATMYHQGNDDQSYGMWKPKDRYNFYVHDSAKNCAYIGGGCSSRTDIPEGISGIIKILDAIAASAVPDTGFYTATIFIPQAGLDSQAIGIISGAIDAITPYAEQKLAIWSSLTQTGNIWRTFYQGKPFRVDCSQIANINGTETGSYSTR